MAHVHLTPDFDSCPADAETGVVNLGSWNVENRHMWVAEMEKAGFAFAGLIAGKFGGFAWRSTEVGRQI